MLTYPTQLAPRGTTVDKYTSKNGKKIFNIPDPYRFLEDPESEKTQKWVEAQNEVSKKFLGTCSLTDKIFKKVKYLSDYSKIGVPTKHGDHFFFLH